ncbi:MAG: metallophosphoesterase [Oscillospiraceae bacterium]
MSIFAIGDTHLSFSTDKPMDIFRGWSDYTARLQKNWCAIVREDDTVVIPGDISWAMDISNAKSDFDFLNALPGKKVILKGNHDYWWATMRRMNEFLLENNFNSIKILFNNCIEAGDFAICGTRGWFFDDETIDEQKVLAREVGRLKTSIEAAKKTGKEPIVFLHYPPINTVSVCQPIIQVLKESEIKRCYYGHLHGESLKRAFRNEYEGIKFDVVSADFLEFCPKIIENF